MADRPGMARALVGTLRDLRDAGVPAAALRDSELRDLYARSEAALDELETHELLDRVRLFRRACSGAGAWVGRMGFRSIELHGATELVGSAGDLIDALARAAPLRMLQTDWGSAYARELRTSSPWSFLIGNVKASASHVQPRPSRFRLATETLSFLEKLPRRRFERSASNRS